MAKQIDENKPIAHQPSVVEIQQMRLTLFESHRVLRDEGVDIYASRSALPSPPSYNYKILINQDIIVHRSCLP